MLECLGNILCGSDVADEEQKPSETTALENNLRDDSCEISFACLFSACFTCLSQQRDYHAVTSFSSVVVQDNRKRHAYQ